ncbi:MAG: GPR endopeptidase [Clostridium sp.]|nr:GPR endopeptidase [Clostridium sp.]MCM1444470.1 GPR endopeptidase [Candidatus Amulumruptor caecigallinarius]
MNKKIDLSKYSIRTDLLVESIKDNNEIKKYVEENENIKITRVYMDKKNGEKINKKEGNYVTIEFDDVTDTQNKEKVKKIFSNELKNMISNTEIKENPYCLIVGLGNDKSTPDSLGPLSINNIIVTSHLFEIENIIGFTKVSAINPGVMGQTGIETSDIILSVIEKIKPDFLIVIDSLASSSIERVNKTIQMTDTGIHPGSGIGNSRKEISKETLNIPVIAIGVPTVVDANVIVSDTINYMYKHYAFNKEFIKNPISKLVPNGVNYLKKDINISDLDKKKLFGIIGTLNEDEIKELIYEVLTPIGYNLMVTPKEIDFIIEKLSDVIGNGINMALHDEINSST